jgi:formate dehydrogenase maturation protein FdhE
MSDDFFEMMTEGLSYYLDFDDVERVSSDLRETCALKTVLFLNPIQDYQEWANRLAKRRKDFHFEDYLELIRTHDSIIRDSK